jgi:uncharacterized protein (UPF0333 family)
LAKKTPTPSPISTKTKKSDATAKVKGVVVKVPNKKNRTSNASKTQRRVA